MTKGRLEAFSDGVIAIIITIMVLEMKVPHGDGLEGFGAAAAGVSQLCPEFLYVGIYWNNHHHMLHTCTVVTGGDALGQSAFIVLAVVISFHRRMDGREPFHCGAYCVLRRGAVDGRDRLLLASADDHPRARAGLNLEEGDRARLEGQAIAAAVYRSDRCQLPFFVDRASDFRDRCADLADSGPAHRKTSCRVVSACSE